METPIGEIDETSPLCQAVEDTKDARKVRMPDKLKALELYTRIAGDGAAVQVQQEITHIDRLCAEHRK